MIAAAPAVDAWSVAAVTLTGLAILLAPGAVVLTALRAGIARGEAPAYAFATSLALLTAAFAACLALGTSIAAAAPMLAAVTLLAAWLATRARPAPGAAREFDTARGADAAAADSTVDSAQPPREPPSLSPQRPSIGAALSLRRAPVATRVVLAVVAAFCVAAAVRFAPVGSIDRWWYLAYVRSFAEAHVLTLAEPFLGSGEAFARFGVHPWIFALALWSRLAGVDPIPIYERAAPVIVMIAAVSAASALANALFGAGSRARLTVLATMLLWSGAMVPLLARAGEDKVMAAAVLFPLCSAAFLSVTARDGPRTRRVELLLLLAAATATAAVHALAYAFVLVALMPVACVLALRHPSRRSALATAVVVLLVVAIAPAVSGLVVRDRLHEIGADLASPDHPVVRVHEGRERLVEIPSVGYVVNPRLLLHPLALLAALGLVLVARRGVESAGGGDAVTAALTTAARTHDGEATAAARRDHHTTATMAGVGHWSPATVFLASTTIVPLAIAFLPPLPALAGSLIPPWMVYRVLWLLPLAPLAAIAADAVATRILPASRSRCEAIAVLLLLIAGLPIVFVATRDRLADVRDRLASPASADFRALVDAVKALPEDALVAVAPELSERLPAFTARAMVASLDRSTVVFAGSRERGEARLRARAAVLAGDDDAAALAAAAKVHPTHAIFDPRRADPPRCATLLFESAAYTLCRLEEGGDSVAATGSLEPSAALGGIAVAVADCASSPRGAHRDPWSAAAPVVTCPIVVPASLRDRDDVVLRIAVVTGRAADEIRVTVMLPGSSPRRATVRVGANQAFALQLPRLATDRVDVRVASSFLPSLKIAQVVLATR